MSSGDAEAPPPYYFSGMTFNPDFYTSSTSTYLTKITGKNIFYRIQKHKEMKQLIRYIHKIFLR